MTPRTAIFAAIALMLAPLAAPQFAHGQMNKEQYTYRCIGKDGKKYYGQTIPSACFGQPLELINRQGMMVKRIDPEGDEKARLAKEAEAEKKRELAAAQKESMRRSRALLATYTSENDIEESRKRDLANHQRGVQEVESRITEIKRRQTQYQKELALFQEAGKGAPPARLQVEITNAEIDLKAQQALLDAKKKETVSINARYDEDRRNYREAIGKPAR